MPMNSAIEAHCDADSRKLHRDWLSGGRGTGERMVGEQMVGERMVEGGQGEGGGNGAHFVVGDTAVA